MESNHWTVYTNHTSPDAFALWGRIKVKRDPAGGYVVQCERTAGTRQDATMPHHKDVAWMRDFLGWGWIVEIPASLALPEGV